MSSFYNVPECGMLSTNQSGVMDSDTIALVLENSGLLIGKRAVEDTCVDGMASILLRNHPMLQYPMREGEPVLENMDVTEKFIVTVMAVEELGKGCSVSDLQIVASIRRFSPSASSISVQKSGQKNCARRYKLHAEYRICRSRYTNEAALKANALQLNPSFLAAVNALLEKDSVSVVKIQEFSEMYGDAIVSEAVIGVSATAEQVREFASVEEAQETAAALQAELTRTYGSCGPLDGALQDDFGGNGNETEHSMWLWKVRGSNVDAEDPRALLAPHQNDPTVWRTIECAQFKSVFSLLPADVQERCLAKFGHLVPMHKVHGDLDYVGLHKWDAENHCAVMHGRGTSRCIAEPYVGQIYNGEWLDGKRSGLGVHTLPCGSRYEGSYLNDKKHGNGVYEWFDGDTYNGEWKDGKMHGTGVFRVTTGANYVGEWQHGKKHGQGVHTYANGDSYDGAWQDDKRHGYGVRKYVDGESYRGEWVNGERNGKGVRVWASGSSYDGEWQHGKRHGQGVHRYKSGVVLAGKWVGGKICAKEEA